MKIKTILFIMALINSKSCISKNDASEKVNKSYYNPPAWIIGTWKDTSAPTVAFTFTNDDIIYTVEGFTFSYKEEITKLIEADVPGAGVKENIDDNNYKAQYNLSDSVRKIFIFTKNSDTEITSTNYLDGIYIKQ